MLNDICNNGMYTTIPPEKNDYETIEEIPEAPALIAMTDAEISQLQEEIFGEEVGFNGLKFI